MAEPKADRVAQVFYPINSNSNAPNCKPASLIAKSTSLTATNHAVASDSQHSTASNSPITGPQVSYEIGDIRDKDPACDNPAEFLRAFGGARTSVKSHSSATSSSMDGVFLTAPETPTGSVDHELRPSELFDSSSGPYNAAGGPDVPPSPTVSKATKSESADNKPEQFSSINCDSQVPEAAMRKQERVVQISASLSSIQEESITGARLGLKADIFPHDNPAFSQPRRRNRVVQTPRSGRRHAIPIIRPPTPGSEESPLEPYDHGLEGVPSHYIPLYGSLHGMFYDPIIKMFVGDGSPRPNPERPDGSLPCRPENTQVAVANAADVPKTSITADMLDVAIIETKSGAALRRKNPDDALHIQPRSFIDDFNLVPQPAGDSHPLELSVPGDEIYPVGCPSNKKLYFCRCMGEWLPNRHQCNRGPLEKMKEQSGLPITSQTQLPDGWVTHRIVVDPSIYPGGVVPERTASGPKVGGQPAKYFTPVSETGTDPRTAEAARAAAFAIAQSRGASQVRAMRHGTASSDAKASISPSFNISLPIRSESNVQHFRPPANDNDAETPIAPIIATSDLTTATADLTTATAGPIIASTGPAITTPGSAIAPLDPTTATSDSTTAVLGPATVVPDPTTTPAPPSSNIALDPTSHNEPNATTPPRGLGRPAQKVAGQRRHGKGSHKSRKSR